MTILVSDNTKLTKIWKPKFGLLSTLKVLYSEKYF